MIRAEGVCKSFDKKEVLTDIDAVFEPGKVNREEWFREDRVIKVVDWLALD